MAAQNIATFCLNRFEAHFAQRAVEQFQQPEDWEALWHVLEQSQDFASNKIAQQQLDFRAAYILETLFLKEPLCVSRYAQRFFSLFFSCTNGSAQRHFSKIMAIGLQKKYLQPDQDEAERIAETAATWCVDPKIRVAAKIWCVEILRILSSQVDWITPCLDDILNSLPQKPSIGVRKRQWISNSNHENHR